MCKILKAVYIILLLLLSTGIVGGEDSRNNNLQEYTINKTYLQPFYINEDIIIVVYHDDYFGINRLTGEQWELELDISSSGRVSVYNNMLIAKRWSAIKAFNIYTGKMLWSTKVDDLSFANFKIYNDKIEVISNKDGGILYRLDLEGNIIEANNLLLPEKCFIKSFDNRGYIYVTEDHSKSSAVYYADFNTEVKWHYNLPPSDTVYSGLSSTPILTDKYVILKARTGRYNRWLVLDRNSGDLIKEFMAHGASSLRLHVLDGYGILLYDSNGFTLYDLDDISTIKWKNNLNYYLMTGEIYLHNDIIFVENGYSYGCIDVNSGEKVGYIGTNRVVGFYKDLIFFYDEKEDKSIIREENLKIKSY